MNILFCLLLLLSGGVTLLKAQDSVETNMDSSVTEGNDNGDMATVNTPIKTVQGVLTECPKDMEYIISRKRPKQVREFCIDRYEYPNRKGEWPMGDITWYKAKSLCDKIGKRLCMDWEWEEACAGLNVWDYAYYNVYDESKCNVKGETVVKSGEFGDCKTRNYEVWDMVGNLREWTAGGGVGAAGGDFKAGRSARCSKWEPLSLKRSYVNTGFRCCVKVNTGRYGKIKGRPLSQGTAPVNEGLQDSLPPFDESMPLDTGAVPAQ